MQRLVVLMGAPGSGKTSQLEMIRSRFSAIFDEHGRKSNVHVTTIESGRLLREMSGESEVDQALSLSLSIEEKQLIRDLFNSGKIATRLPAELLSKCIRYKFGSHICGNDAKDKANTHDENRLFLFYRGPSNVDSAAYLMDQAHILPDMVVVLRAEDDVLIERICNRRIDPVTRKTYHLLHDPPPSNDPHVLRRLVHRLGDERDMFLKRLGKHQELTDPVLELYESRLTKDRIRHIDASLDREQVFQRICDALSDSFGAKGFAVGIDKTKKRRKSG